MKSAQALRMLAELTSSQWGMVTSAQASMHGLTRLDLSRLSESGHLVRLAHGIYRDAGAPGDEFEELRAVWLSTDPARFAAERLGDSATGVTVSGPSAAQLLRIGDLPADIHTFTSPTRRQSQRDRIRYRMRELDPQDVTVVEGLPTTTPERTIADLVEDRQDLSLVADALRDASDRRALDLGRLQELLAPLAGRNGFQTHDGRALLNRLMEIAGIDLQSVARRIASTPDLGAIVATNFARNLPQIDVAQLISPTLTHDLDALFESAKDALNVAMQPTFDQLSKTMSTAASAALNRAFDDLPRLNLPELLISDALHQHRPTHPWGWEDSAERPVGGIPMNLNPRTSSLRLSIVSIHDMVES